MSINLPENLEIVALSMIDGIGSVKAKKLIKNFGDIKEIFSASKSDLLKIEGINQKIVEKIILKSTFKMAENELNFCQKNKINIISIDNIGYPKRLLEVDDSPIVLYSKGNIHENIGRSLGIVGTRKNSENGSKFIHQSLSKLSQVSNIATISGLALGIDQKVHLSSIEYNIPTIAVMAIALDKVFPPQNVLLAEKILENNGGWISETNSQEKTNKGVFPKRNRIIAALSDALLVVETNIKGGSIITAKLANDYNKDVFALPGRYQDSFSKGCNYLIRENLARLITSIDELLIDMDWMGTSYKKTPNSIEIPFEGTEFQKIILSLIRKIPEISIDRLSIETQKLPSELSPDLITLEMDGFIRSKPGNKYEIV